MSKESPPSLWSRCLTFLGIAPKAPPAVDSPPPQEATKPGTSAATSVATAAAATAATAAQQQALRRKRTPASSGKELALPASGELRSPHAPPTPQLHWRYNIEALAEMLRPSMRTQPEGAAEVDLSQAPLPTHSREEVEKAISELRNLPVLASIASSFQAATREEATPLQKIADLVRRDPGLNARILKMANSGLMRADHDIVEIEHAIVRLGTDRIRYMAQGLNTVSQLSKLSPQFEFRHLWSHSLASALLAEKLNEITGGQAETHIYSAALLHDVGKIVLASIFPDTYRIVLAGCARPGADLSERERQAFGMDHAEAGLIFARSHHFPPAIQCAIGAHGNPALVTGTDGDTVRLVAAANFFAKKYQMGFSGNPRLVALHREKNESATSPGKPPAQGVGRGSPEAETEEDPWEIALTPFLPALREELDQLLILAYKKS